MSLRDYQATDIAELRPLIREHRSVLHQLPTGGGKTAEVAEIVSLAMGLSAERVIWFVVPRNELLKQASKHFARWKIPHGIIAAGKEESRAFRVHIVSKDTLLRRLHRIKRWPDVLIFDEAHLYYDAQALIIDTASAEKPALKVIGLTATPERLDGRGLGILMVDGVNIGGPYECIHYGPSIPWLTERDFLAPLRYFAPPPIEGFDKLHWRGTEVIEAEYEAFIDRNKRVIYGNVIKFYRKYGVRENGGNRPALIFTRSVKSAKETAAAFNDAGYNFRAIWGDMPKGDRDFAFRAMREEHIDGLVNCDLATYGVDIPNLEYGASIRPTLSRALYFQMVGRLLRPFAGKREAFFIDHANMIKAHTDPRYPGVPLFFVPDIQWNFTGTEKRERAEPTDAMRFCPYRDGEYCRDPACKGRCKLLPVEEQEVMELDVPLVERTAPKAWTTLAPEERRDVQDRIGAATDAWLSALTEDPPRIAQGPVGELLRVAEELGRAPMWVYWHLVERDAPRLTVNVTLLHEIARQKGYKPGWVWWKRKQIEEGVRERELVS